ncbi:hypothetical protein NLM27_36080 [Bradyrhizobium sp. CCGB12]|uniref:hypothetical protein n=1 Tax=Bradyrhizobium sp. CCGB12 TaxID=2949632 RepID=UPI0020B2AF8A|nr:hypothetical protein [Bradyrhizobium sp. CCGB12]MCP3394176.1 hypothetical protein [Bradyrhizobium sp. CCGB12]
MATATPAPELRRIARTPRCQRRGHHDHATCHWPSSRGSVCRDRCRPGRLGIINHDLFPSNAEVQRVIRRSIDGTSACALERLKRDEIRMNRHRALGYCLSMIFSENRLTLFRIML